MEDARIIDLYWARSENAIAEASAKYGKYCCAIACNVLANHEDADESVNDTYLEVWNNMPPHRPSILSTSLGKITRRISIDKWRGRTAEKRGGGEIVPALDELSDCVPSGHNVEQEVEAAELAKVIDTFVMSLPLMGRRVFICRYWYLDPISVISQQFGFSESKVKMMLHVHIADIQFLVRFSAECKRFSLCVHRHVIQLLGSAEAFAMGQLQQIANITFTKARNHSFHFLDLVIAVYLFANDGPGAELVELIASASCLHLTVLFMDI